MIILRVRSCSPARDLQISTMNSCSHCFDPETAVGKCKLLGAAFSQTLSNIYIYFPIQIINT
ncbi:hypothetical protein Hanom_Chr02g00139011 [Helianthus anomalus]